MAEWKIEKETIKALTECEDISKFDPERIFSSIQKEKQITSFIPDEYCQIDPRDGAMILYNTARAKRPHDNAPNKKQPEKKETKSCPVCEGKTTGVVDVAELSKGYTFINKNLFPILYPPEVINPRYLEESLYPDPSHHGRAAWGIHLLQWSSSYHNDDWHNMAREDRITVLNRLAAVERKLLFESENLMPPSSQWRSQKETNGFVSIIKNYGAAVGGSLTHGHQQIAFGNIMPRSFFNNLSFMERKGEYFSEFLLMENPPELVVKDYGKAVLLVPYFMKRPYNMILLVRDVGKQYLCELTEYEIAHVADGLHDATKAILEIMPRIGKEPAYNITVHNGPGAGLYFELLPYTQETGGFEHLGLWVCQNNPINAASSLRNMLESPE